MEFFPDSVYLQNNKSSLDSEDFVDYEIESLLDKKIIIKCNKVPSIINLLSVATNSHGKKRLILDLRHVNKCVFNNKFKLEDFNSAIKYCNENDFMFKFDLKSDYHDLDINPSNFQNLCFCWKNVYYSFTVLPCGLSSAPFIFTQLFKPLIKYWRSQGQKIVIYLDDGL